MGPTPSIFFFYKVMKLWSVNNGATLSSFSSIGNKLGLVVDLLFYCFYCIKAMVHRKSPTGNLVGADWMENLRWANTDPSMHKRESNTDPSINFRNANTDPSMHFKKARQSTPGRRRRRHYDMPSPAFQSS